MLEAAHLGVDLFQDLGALLQAEQDILLYEGELDARGELLELLELGVGFGEQRLLVLFAAQRKEGPLLVAPGKRLARDLGFSVRQDGDAALVLVQLVALDLEVEDCSMKGGRETGSAFQVAQCTTTCE